MFLAKLCPHELFTNTKADLGSCGGEHDDDVKAEFDKLPSYKKQAYEDEFNRFANVSVLNPRPSGAVTHLRPEGCSVPACSASVVLREPTSYPTLLWV